MNAPVLLAFLTADKVFREAETGKVHVAGIFNRAGAVAFPFLFPQIFVYVALSDLKEGEHRIGLDLRHMDANEDILRISQPIRSPGPLEVIEVIFGLNRLVVKEAGTLVLELSCNGEVVASRSLAVFMRDAFPHGGHPPQGQ